MANKEKMSIEICCQNCETDLTFMDGERLGDTVECPDCGINFIVKDNEVLYHDADISPELRFEKELGSFKVNVLLSIFFDVFFIFTVLSFSKRRWLFENIDKSSRTTVDSVKSWNIFFILAVWIRGAFWLLYALIYFI